MMKKIDKGGYTVYELAQEEENWGVALIEIQDSPKHFHKIEQEIFIVVEGTLSIEVDGSLKTLEKGESINLAPGTVHKLSSATGTPVRVLCISIPAFDPADMYVTQNGQSIH